MKKTEAIRILATSARPREPKDRARYDEAVKMAIEALKCSERTAETAQPDHTADIGKKVFISCGHENDQISRQALYKYAQNQKDKSATPNDIMWFPSAQPELTQGLHNACTDAISRQAAIDALDKRFDDVPMELTTEILQLRHDLRERIPSAQPATNCSEIPNSSDDTISRQAAIDALNEYFARIGKLKRRGLTKGEKAISLDTVGVIKNAPPAEAIPISWIEAKIELVNDLSGVSMLKMKAADWVDLVKQWRAEQRNPDVNHDALIRELAEEMQKHGVT